MEWRLADAKNKFSELVNRALSDGPQRVRRQDDVVVILAERDCKALTGEMPSFKDFLLQAGPTFEGLDLERDKSLIRNVELI